MRSGWWILTICAVGAVALTAVAADESPWNSQSERGPATKPASAKSDPFGARPRTEVKPANQFFSRSGDEPETPAAAPQRYERPNRTPVGPRIAAPGVAVSPAAAAETTAAPPAARKYYEEMFGEKSSESTNPFATDAKAGDVKTADAKAPPAKDDPLLDKLQQTSHEEPADGQPALPPVVKPSPNGVINAGYKEAEGSAGKIQQLRSVGKPPLTAAVAPAARKEPVPAAKTASATTEESGSPHVTAKWHNHGDFNIGQECHCSLVVKNSGDAAAHDLVVEAFFPASVRILKAEPFPAESQDRLVWKIAALPAGEEKTLDIRLLPSKRGDLATSATVHYACSAAASFRVEEPELQVALQGVQEVMIGESASQLIVVSNPGSGVAHDVVVQALIPAGLEHSAGKKLTMGIGALAAGESRSIRLALTAVSGGDQLLQVETRTSGASLVRKAETHVHVVAPNLTLQASGPNLRYINRNAKYTFTVTNNSNAATNNVRVVETLPGGFKFLKANHGGQLDNSGKIVSWFVGRLEAGQSAALELELTATETGSHRHEVRALADGGVNVTAATETLVDSVASLVMEVNDLDDPVEVGVETAYQIRVRNEGSKDAQNLSISCELPTGVELVSGKGPTEFVSEGGVLMFRALDHLAPKDTATYVVHVRGSEAGNARFRARLTSDSIQKPLIVEEVTKVYAD